MLDPAVTEGWFQRRLIGERLYFARELDATTRLGYFDLETSSLHILAELPMLGLRGFSLAPCEKQALLVTVVSSGSDLLLLESSDAQ